MLPNKVSLSLACLIAAAAALSPLALSAEAEKKAALGREVLTEPEESRESSIETMTIEDLRAQEAKLMKRIKAAESDAQPDVRKTSLETGRKDVSVKKEASAAVAVKQSAPADRKESKGSYAKVTVGKSSFKRELDETTDKLRASEAKVENLTKDLEEARNRLLIAETEVQQLSRLLEARKASDLAGGRSGKAPASIPASITARSADKAAPTRSEPKVEDTQIATVVVDKAYLRSGPGKNNSPLISVTQGTRLVIEIEQNGWYRVISPTGDRAWVDSSVIAFGAKAGESPTKTVKVKGFGATVDEAFNAIRTPAPAK